MKVYNPTEVSLYTRKDNETWEVLPKSIQEFPRDLSINMQVDEGLDIIEKDIELEDIVQE